MDKLFCKCCRCWRNEEEYKKDNKTFKSCNNCREKLIKRNKKDKEYKKEYDKTRNKTQNYKEEKKEYDKTRYETQKEENPLLVKTREMITSSKSHDKKKNLSFNTEEYITIDFLIDLYKKQEQKCYYKDCKCILTFEFNKYSRTNTQISVQRLKNDLAHIKDNCVLSCFKCNVYDRKELIKIT